VLIDLPDVKNRLYKYKFEKKDSGDWLLVLKPAFYTKIFENREPSIYNKRCHREWKESQFNTDELLNFFTDLSEEEIHKVREFIEDYSLYRLIGKSSEISLQFSDELDFCMALDKNFLPPVDGNYTRTKIGELFYNAKYDKCTESLLKLGKIMSYSIFKIPYSDFSENSCITYIPRKPDEEHYIPALIVDAIIANNLDILDDDCTIIQANLAKNLKSMKDLSFSEKMTYWSNIISSDYIKISGSVSGKNVYIIDDLYQSGISMWSFAKYLKSQGANKVFGLVCVKAGKDTDNK